MLARGAGAAECLDPGPAQFFRGFSSRLTLDVEAAEDGLDFGVFLAVQDDKLFARGPGQCVRCSAIVTACPEVPGASIRTFSVPQCSIGGSWGARDFWGLGPQAGWDAEAWADTGLLLDGGRAVRVVATLEAP